MAAGCWGAVVSVTIETFTFDINKFSVGGYEDIKSGVTTVWLRCFDCEWASDSLFSFALSDMADMAMEHSATCSLVDPERQAEGWGVKIESYAFDVDKIHVHNTDYDGEDFILLTCVDCNWEPPLDMSPTLSGLVEDAMEHATTCTRVDHEYRDFPMGSSEVTVGV
jgi:hypothetical protein